MGKIASALIAHTWRIMTFRHDGAGLPKERTPLLYLLCILLALSGLTQFFASSMKHSLPEYLLAYGLISYATFKRPDVFGMFLLPCLFCNLLYIPLYLLIGKVPLVVDVAIMLWAFASGAAVFTKSRRREGF